MIELRDISFSYGGKKIIDSVSLDLSGGEMCAWIGKNGSGKTTLARIIARQLEPSGGECRLDGKDYSTLSGKDFAKKVSFFPQSRPLPDMSVYDNVSHGRYPYSKFSCRLTATDREAISRALALTDTEKFANRTLASLSGGERQAVYLAMLIAQDAPYLLLDEPTTYMDISKAFDLFELLGKLKSEGRCIIAIMHDIGHALEFFDRVILLDGAMIAFDGTPMELCESGATEKALGVACERQGGAYLVKRIQK